LPCCECSVDASLEALVDYLQRQQLASGDESPLLAAGDAELIRS
jgi:hypothetical protein